MHSTQHTRDELVDAITLLHQRHQGADPALIVRTSPEMREDELLKTIDLILQRHEIRDSLIPLVRIINRFQGDVFFVLEGAVELRVVAVEGEFRNEVEDVLLDQR